MTSPKVVLKVNGRAPSRMPNAAFAVPPLQDQFLVGLLDEGSEELAPDFETGLMDERLDLVGEMLVLSWYGQREFQRQPERERCP